MYLKYNHYKAHIKLFLSLASGDSETRMGSYSSPVSDLPSCTQHFPSVHFQTVSSFRADSQMTSLSQSCRLDSLSMGQVQHQEIA